jgi:hypothetical protein
MLKAEPVRELERRLSGWGAVVAWALEYSVFPGRTRAIEGVDLYRHVLAAGYSLGQSCLPIFKEFGSGLNQLGLSKGRSKKAGVDRRVRLMTADAAAYFLEWLEVNPRPPGVWARSVSPGFQGQGVSHLSTFGPHGRGPLLSTDLTPRAPA